MSVIDDKTPIILEWIDKIGSDFQKIFRNKFGSMKIPAKPTVLVNFRKFRKFHFFSGVGSWGCRYILDRNRVKTVKSVRTFYLSLLVLICSFFSETILGKL